MLDRSRRIGNDLLGTLAKGFKKALDSCRIFFEKFFGRDDCVSVELNPVLGEGKAHDIVKLNPACF